jgi:hypothetical protein
LEGASRENVFTSLDFGAKYEHISVDHTGVHLSFKPLPIETSAVHRLGVLDKDNLNREVSNVDYARYM